MDYVENGPRSNGGRMIHSPHRLHTTGNDSSSPYRCVAPSTTELTG